MSDFEIHTDGDGWTSVWWKGEEVIRDHASSALKATLSELCGAEFFYEGDEGYRGDE